MILLQTPLSQNTLVAILEALIMMAIAAYIGWWLARRTFAVQVDGLYARIAAKERELADCNGSVMKRDVEITPIAITPPAVSIPGVTTWATTEPISNDIPDDLKVVEGIGPKIEDLLHRAGIRTFAQLALTPPEHIKAILNAAGSRFQIHDPSTWPQQAALARDEQWEELKVWQDQLKGGKTE